MIRWRHSSGPELADVLASWRWSFGSHKVVDLEHAAGLIVAARRLISLAEVAGLLVRV